MERINPQEKSKPIDDAKNFYFNEVIRLRSEYITKTLEKSITQFDYTALLRALIGLVSHTVYYLPESRKYGNKPLKKVIVEFINQKSTDLLKPASIEEGLKISEEYITALQEESICSFK